MAESKKPKIRLSGVALGEAYVLSSSGLSWAYYDDGVNRKVIISYKINSYFLNIYCDKVQKCLHYY